MRKIVSSVLLASCLLAQDLSYQEIQNIAKESADDFLKEYHGRDKATLVVSSFKNDTDIDDEIFTRSLLREIRKSGRYNLVNSVGGDSMVYDARSLRDNEEFNPETTTEKGELVAPDISLSGKISKQSNGDEEIYLFLLTLTDIKTGLVIWDRDVVLTKGKDSSTTSFKAPTTSQQNIQSFTAETANENTSQSQEKARTSFFLLGVDGGAGKGKDTNLLYYVDVKLGYTYKWNYHFAFSIYGLYEFHNKTILQSLKQDRLTSTHDVFRDKNNQEDENEEQSTQQEEGYQQSIGAGIQFKLTYLYFGVNFATDFGDKTFRYFFDAGLTFPIGFANLNLGARYTLLPSSSAIKDFYSGTIGISFNL